MPIYRKINQFIDDLELANKLNKRRSKKIDIKCWCCETIDLDKIQLKNISNQKCYGLKISFMVEKVVEEIELAQVRRESDGTYLSEDPLSKFLLIFFHILIIYKIQIYS